MSQITIIHILRKEGLDYKNIISSNSFFLKNLDAEYLIYDTLDNFQVLKFIKNIGDLNYVRKKFINTKESFLDAGMLANSENLIFLKSGDILDDKNIKQIENSRPKILKEDLWKVGEIKKTNFDYNDFNLLIKDKKTFFEKLKLLFV